MKERNEKKAKVLYDFLDESKLFHGTVRKEDRSLMNVPFVTGDKELDAKFVKEANGSRLREPKGTQNRRRHARKHLQCNADGGRGEAGCIYEESLKSRMQSKGEPMFKIQLPESDRQMWDLKNFSEQYQITADINEADGVLVRSASMHDMEIPEGLLAVARAGAGVNNIPLDKCAEKGVVVFNTPGANANGVKELVLAGMLLAARDVVGGIEWVKANRLTTQTLRRRRRRQKKNFAGTEIMGKKLGVIGLGAIGVKVANAAVASRHGGATATTPICRSMRHGI